MNRQGKLWRIKVGPAVSRPQFPGRHLWLRDWHADRKRPMRRGKVPQPRAVALLTHNKPISHNLT